ncbi:MAG: CDP-glucose 4,6-dehydratase, partial [Nitrosarchaeum sp.]
MGIDTKFWKGKKVLVTGHTGFKGSWLSLWLQKLGTDLVGFSKDVPTTPSLYELADVGNGMTSVIGDVRNYKQVEDFLKKNEPEIVIHLAAQAILRRSYQDPVETYSTNVMGTVNVLEAVRKSSSVKVVLNVTSDKCYQVKNSSEGYREDNPMGGFDPYSNSKGCAELVTSSYRNSFFNQHDYDKHGISLASARAGNVIGGGDWGADRLVPDIMRGVLGGKEIIIRNPNSVRPWQYILDPLEGYLVLIEKLWKNGSDFSEGWNFGPTTNDLKPVSWIV